MAIVHVGSTCLFSFDLTHGARIRTHNTLLCASLSLSPFSTSPYLPFSLSLASILSFLFSLAIAQCQSHAHSAQIYHIYTNNFPLFSHVQ